MGWLASFEQLDEPTSKLAKSSSKLSLILSEFGRRWLLWKAVLNALTKTTSSL